MTYILSQVFVTIYYVFVIATYQEKKRERILSMNMISLVAMGVSYFFLSAYSGISMIIIGMIRNIMFFFDEKYKKTDKISTWNIIELIILFALSIIFSMITYDGPLSMMPVISTLLYTFSIWQQDTQVYKILGVPIGLTEIIYNVYIKSIIGVIFEGLTFLSAIIGYIREIYDNKEKGKNKDEKVITG